MVDLNIPSRSRDILAEHLRSMLLNVVTSPAIDDPTKTICEAEAPEATYNQPPASPPDYDVIPPVLKENVVSNFLQELTLVLLFSRGEREFRAHQSVLFSIEHDVICFGRSIARVACTACFGRWSAPHTLLIILQRILKYFTSGIAWGNGEAGDCFKIIYIIYDITSPFSN